MKKRGEGSVEGARGEVRLGLTIGHDRIMAVRLSTRGDTALALEAPLASKPVPGTPWTELEEALRGLLEECWAARAVADVAILPPLSRSKCVDVPAVSASQLDPLIKRNLRRYFAVPFPSPLSRARPTATRSGKVTRALAVCADAGVIAAIHHAAEEAGIRIASITAGPVALAEGVRRRLVQGRGRVLVTWGARGWSGAMEVDGGVPRWLEDWTSLSDSARAERTATSRMTGDGAEPPIHTVVLTELGLHDAAVGGGNPTAPPGSGSATSRHDPWILTALGAAVRGHQAPSLLPRSRVADLRRAALRRALTLWASAAALVVAAAGVHGYGLKRELSAVQGAREFIAPQVSRALEIRRTAYAVQDRLEALDGIERDTPRWTPALAALTEVLPSSTYLVSLSTDGLSVRLGGVTRATEIIAPELEDSPFFRDVRLMNVRASSSPGEEGTEFDLSLALQAAVSPTPEGGGGQ